ncbi:MAG TPA: response regulator [Bryobacteraceae bacterium]|jgi:CheY-like chemotaxis protein|nr:response regulator [Bryobacteraceae bacterium]
MSSPITILLAEDNPGDVFLVRRALEKHGLQEIDLVVVEDGQSALRYIERVDTDDSATAPDLALLDLNLPRATGSRILTRIRKSARCSLIPIIIVTSSDSPLDRDAAAELGATGYFQKPGDLAGFMLLGQVIRDALNGQVSQTAGG